MIIHLTSINQAYAIVLNMESQRTNEASFSRATSSEGLLDPTTLLSNSRDTMLIQEKTIVVIKVTQRILGVVIKVIQEVLMEDIIITIQIITSPEVSQVNKEATMEDLFSIMITITGKVTLRTTATNFMVIQMERRKMFTQNLVSNAAINGANHHVEPQIPHVPAHISFTSDMSMSAAPVFTQYSTIKSSIY